MSRICAIHQPNFFPWLGFFEKIRRSDVFVLLDNVDYPKSGNSMGSWVNRVRIAVSGRPVWLRVPVVREHGPQVIRNVRIDDATPWRAKLLRTLEINYRRAPRHAACMSFIKPLVNYECELVADYNTHAVSQLATALGLRCKFVRQSALSAAGGGTELLVNIVRELGASVYLCGDGAEGYQIDDLFLRNGLGLERLNYVQEPYSNPAPFVPGLSVIDFLMHREPESFALVATQGAVVRLR